MNFLVGNDIMKRAAAALTAIILTASVTACGGSGAPSACTQYHQHVRVEQRAATARGEKVARKLAVSLGQPAGDADQRVAKTTAQAYLDTALEHVKRPANCQ